MTGHQWCGEGGDCPIIPRCIVLWPTHLGNAFLARGKSDPDSINSRVMLPSQILAVYVSSGFSPQCDSLFEACILQMLVLLIPFSVRVTSHPRPLQPQVPPPRQFDTVAPTGSGGGSAAASEPAGAGGSFSSRHAVSGGGAAVRLLKCYHVTVSDL